MKLLLKIIISLLPLVGFSQKKLTQEVPISILLDSINHQIIYHTSTSIHRLDHFKSKNYKLKRNKEF